VWRGAPLKPISCKDNASKGPNRVDSRTMLSLAAVYSARRDLSRQKLFAVNCTPSNDARLPIYSDFLSSKKCEETCLGELKLVLTHAFLERYFFWIGNEFSIREEKNKKKRSAFFFSVDH